MHASRGPSSSLTISRIFVSSQVSLTFLATNSFIFWGVFPKLEFRLTCHGCLFRLQVMTRCVLDVPWRSYLTTRGTSRSIVLSRGRLIWRPRDVPGRLNRDVPRTLSGRPLKDLQNTSLEQCGVICCMSLNFFLLFFRNLFDWPNQPKSNSIIKVYLEPTRTSKMELFLQNYRIAFIR